MGSPAPRIRGVSGWRAALGLAELLAPAAVLRHVGAAAPPRAIRVVRVLGARQLLQAAVTAGPASPRAARIGAAVDAVHGISMIGLAAVSRRARRPAAIESVSAGLLTGAGLLVARRPFGTRSSASLSPGAQPGGSLAGNDSTPCSSTFQVSSGVSPSPSSEVSGGGTDSEPEGPAAARGSESAMAHPFYLVDRSGGLAPDRR